MTTPAQKLLGKTLSNGWKVVHMIARAPDATGGNFSEGYIVESNDGRKGYLKALDYSSALRSQDPARVLQSMTEAYNFERDLLIKCRDYNLDRIIVCLDDGSLTVDPKDDAGVVQYIIFELADGDIRSQIRSINDVDIAWALRSHHHIVTGLYQLHKLDIAHQDLKPSNALVFKERITKLGDLGRASYKGHQAPHEQFLIAGDPSYAPPDLLYGYASSDWIQRRIGCDLYLMGSMVVFFFTGLGMTSLLFQHLHPSQRPDKWTGAFKDVLPYLRDSFDRAIDTFVTNIPESLHNELPAIVRQLCEPDPDLRGHPQSRRPMWGNPYSLERYVSGFDLLARRAELGIIKRMR